MRGDDVYGGAAAAVGANHLRCRLFVLAYPCGFRSPTGKDATVFAGRLQPQLRDWWATEPAMDRVADGLPKPVDGDLEGLGNAVVPQVAEEIGRMIANALSEVA